MVIIANPYLIALWKNLWMMADRGRIGKNLTDDDYAAIAERSGLSESNLQRRILKADRGVIQKFKTSTLDRLCEALAAHVIDRKLPWSIQNDWASFARSQSRKNIFLVCEQLSGRINTVINDRLRNDISRNARDNAYEIAGSEKGDNLPLFTSVELTSEIKVAEEQDVHGIYEFAKGQYGDCPINGPDIKLPWWEKNKNIFYVIQDYHGHVCANLNLLPMKKDCYERIRSGEIDERGIKASDLYAPDEKDKVEHIYVEGFNCNPNQLASKFLYAFDTIIRDIANPANPDLVVGAIGGTISGENLMSHLGFEVVSVPDERVDDYKFFEINYTTAIRRLMSIKRNTEQ